MIKRRTGRCAICQKFTEDALCLSCKEQWDQDAEWVKELIRLEQGWRRISLRERHFAPLRISVDGQLRQARRRLSANFLLKQTIQSNHVENQWLFSDIELWAVTTGLTTGEQLIYHLMMSGLTGYVGPAVIDEIQQKPITRPAYRRRRRKLYRKIRQAMESDENDAARSSKKS